MNIDDLELTVRSQNALRNAGITTVEQLVTLNWKELNEIKNAGDKSVTEICWQCIQLLNGRMTAQRLEWERRWPPKKPGNWLELQEKARKFDEIAALVNTLTDSPEHL